MLTAVPPHLLSALCVPGAGHPLPLGILPVTPGTGYYYTHFTEEEIET